jgi:hypothetical protein
MLHFLNCFACTAMTMGPAVSVIARSQRVRPSAGPMTGSATKRSNCCRAKPLGFANARNYNMHSNDGGLHPAHLADNLPLFRRHRLH